MHKVQSQDGTTIAFDRVGEGPPLILVSGALGVRSHPVVRQLANLLAPHFTVISYDRRGRGDSGDTQPYAVEREIEDIEALIDQAGGSAFIYGVSSGAVLALEAMSKLPAKVNKLAIYEPPFIIDDSRPPVPADYASTVAKLVQEGRRGDALEYFMTNVVGIPAGFVTQMRNDPSWAEMEKVAHTLAYDGAVVGDTMSGKPLPAERWATATVPILVMSGDASPGWMQHSARTAADLLPNAQHRTLEGQEHNAAPDAIAPQLVEFFTAQ